MILPLRGEVGLLPLVEHVQQCQVIAGAGPKALTCGVRMNYHRLWPIEYGRIYRKHSGNGDNLLGTTISKWVQFYSLLKNVSINCEYYMLQIRIHKHTRVRTYCSEAMIIFDMAGSHGNSDIRRPSRVNSPWWLSAPNAYKCSNAAESISYGGGSRKSKWTRSLMPRLNNNSTTFPRLVRWILKYHV